MNLASHIFLAGVVTAIFTGNPYFALLAGIGSFIPDLDREYIFVSRQTFRKEQFHRALFHNLLFLSGLFFVNIWLALGAFLHSFLDSFTTEKDRGVEWLFPFSRLVKRGRFSLSARSKDGGCKLELMDLQPSDRVCFINEDSAEATKLSDPDLKETRAVPWRRTYGPAANGQLLDRWLALASFSLFALYALINPTFAMAGKNLLFSTQIIPPLSFLSAIVLFFIGGWFKKNKKRKVYYTLLAVGGFLLIFSAALSVNGISGYVFPLNPVFVLVASMVLCVEAFFVWRLTTRGGKKAIV